MEYPTIEQIDNTIKYNLADIYINRPDLYYALINTGFYNNHFTYKPDKYDYLKFVSSLNFSKLNKIKPFNNRK
jgi:hypothetical protein